jgi:hypothetical protein
MDRQHASYVVNICDESDGFINFHGLFKEAILKSCRYASIADYGLAKYVRPTYSFQSDPANIVINDEDESVPSLRTTRATWRTNTPKKDSHYTSDRSV